MKLLLAFAAMLVVAAVTGQSTDDTYVCDPATLPPVDVMFILSSNHTMNQFEFKEKLHIVEEYVKKVNIGENNVRVGIISEYEFADVEFHLDDHMNKTELLRAIPYIYYGPNGAVVGDAFKYMVEEGGGLNDHLGGRPGVPDVVIFLTNSNTAGNDFAKNNSEIIQANATVIGLGVGDFHKLDLVNVASGCHYVDQSPNFTHSHTHLVKAAINLTCDAIALVPANECCELPTCCPHDLDVLFLLDASSTQTKQNFELQKLYAENLTNALFHESGLANNTRIAAMTYSTRPHPQFELDQHINTTGDLLTALEFLPYQYGARHVEEGLKYIMDHDFLTTARPGVQKVVVVTTTGPQLAFPGDIGVETYIDEMERQGVRIVSIGINGVGQDVIDSEVNVMASGVGYGNALIYNDFAGFLAGWKDGLQRVCEGGAPVTPPASSQAPVSSSVSTPATMSSQASVVPTIPSLTTVTVATTAHILNFCDFKPCKNNGSCEHHFNSTINSIQHFCVCTPAWSGPVCDVAKPTTPNTPTLNVSPSETINAGTTVTFTSTTTSPGNVTHKFFKNGQLIVGAGPGANYTIPNAQFTAGANYTSTATINNDESSASSGVTLVVISWCNPDPCQNNATCIDAFNVPFGHNKHLCYCKPGWNGEFCNETTTTTPMATTTTTPMATTTTTPTTTTTTPTTTTTTPATTTFCDLVNPCQNGGTCGSRFDVQNQMDIVFCMCPPGWSGELCADQCHPVPTDLIFLLDASTSETEYNFDKQVDFVANVVGSMEVGADKIQIGLAEFSTRVNPLIKLNEFHTTLDEVAAIKNTTYFAGFTMTNLALKYAREVMLTPADGHRMDAQAVVVVLTDGKSTVPADTVVQAQMLKDTGALVIAVGIGKDVDLNELAAIASGPMHVLKVNSFSLLDTVQQQIVETTTNCGQDSTTPAQIIPTSSITAAAVAGK